MHLVATTAAVGQSAEVSSRLHTVRVVLMMSISHYDIAACVLGPTMLMHFSPNRWYLAAGFQLAPAAACEPWLYADRGRQFVVDVGCLWGECALVSVHFYLWSHEPTLPLQCHGQHWNTFDRQVVSKGAVLQAGCVQKW